VRASEVRDNRAPEPILMVITFEFIVHSGFVPSFVIEVKRVSQFVKPAGYKNVLKIRNKV
jgi:hypothetical protein